MIADLIQAYFTWAAVGIGTCLAMVACWSTFKELAGASN